MLAAALATATLTRSCDLLAMMASPLAMSEPAQAWCVASARAAPALHHPLFGDATLSGPTVYLLILACSLPPRVCVDCAVDHPPALQRRRQGRQALVLAPTDDTPDDTPVDTIIRSNRAPAVLHLTPSLLDFATLAAPALAALPTSRTARREEASAAARDGEHGARPRHTHVVVSCRIFFCGSLCRRRVAKQLVGDRAAPMSWSPSHSPFGLSLAGER